MTIEDTLKKVFSPLHLEVRDDSDKHAGHAESKKLSGTHFGVLLVSSKFEGETILQRHRLVYDALKSEMEGDIHALAIQALTPKEWKERTGVR